MKDRCFDRLLLFGATGDLAQRMLLPSLCALDAEELVDPQLQIVCTARSDFDTQSYRNLARAALEKYLPAGRRGSVATFLNRLSYESVDATSPEGFDRLAKAIGTPEQGLGLDLNQQAMTAVRQWRFAPARMKGTPVDVVVEVEVEFRLR